MADQGWEQVAAEAIEELERAVQDDCTSFDHGHGRRTSDVTDARNRLLDVVRQQAAEVARLRVRLEAALASGAPHPDSARYNDLLFAVATKHPNETRHETAKRYIVEAESRPAIASDALAAGEAEGA